MSHLVRRVFLSVALAITVLHASGCATILNGPDQMVAFSSEPDEATVYVDGVAMGKTPCTLPVPRKGGDKLIAFDRPGYKRVEYTLRNTLDGALAGNILLGGIIGLGIDAISGRGGGYKHSVSVFLESGSGTIVYDGQDERSDKKTDDEHGW